MSEQEKELKRAHDEVERLRGVIRILERELREETMVDPAVCSLSVSILVDSDNPERDCSRLRNALEGLIADDMKKSNDGYLMDEGAVRAEVREAGTIKFDITEKGAKE